MLTRRQLFALPVAPCFADPAGKRGLEFARIRNARKEPENWLTYSGDYAGWRYCPLDQIQAGNVRQLRPEWVFQTDQSGRFQTTPLVADGVMYLTTARSEAIALDARTGAVIWQYKHDLPNRVPTCCLANRGVALLGDKVYLATLDAHLIALDSRTGNVVWDVAAVDYRKGYSFTSAPMAVKDKIVIGPSGGEYGIRGFVDAYDAETGRRVWRFDTIPRPGQFGHDTWEGDSWKSGAAPVWMSGSYDPETNVIYIGTGNPGPDLYGDEREGDNLFSNCLLALDADTGERKWHFQFTPHDLHDWDANIIPILLEADYKGRARKLVVEANRNGYYFVLDRTTGEFLQATPFVKTTWAEQVTPGGMPKALKAATPTPSGVDVCPGVFGGTNWMSPAYSPRTGLLYVVAREECAKFHSRKQEAVEGRHSFGGYAVPDPKDRGYGALRALDPLSGQRRWEYRYNSPTLAGAMSTAGDLVFAGHMDGNFMAFDARSGRNLWRFRTGGPIIASPMSYAVRGRQHVAIASHGALFVFALPGPA